MMTTVADALEYLEAGWSVIPIRDGAKVPAVKSWEPWQSARPDAAKTRKWFRESGRHNIAVILGPVSGDLICRDFDRLESYEAWAAEHRELAKSLPTVETSKGRHVYCRGDFGAIASDEDIQRRKFVTLGDGELRLQGCYCLLPPSIHPSGACYRWLIPSRRAPPILDVRQAGFLPITRNREQQRQLRMTETTEAIEGVARNPETGTQNPGPARFGPAPGKPDTRQIEIPSDIQRAILETVPRGPGQRNKLVFELARALKAVASLADAPATSLKPFVRQWHTLAKPFITTKPFEETWIDFVRGWPRVKFPRGAEPMSQMLVTAMGTTDPPEVAEYEGEQVRLLARLCRELQRSAGTEPFYLSVGTVERLLQVNRGVAHRWLMLFQIDGLLLLVEKGSQQSRRASRYHYRGTM